MSGYNGPTYKTLMVLAKASLLWEHLWPKLWPATALAGVFSAAALLDFFSYLPLWLHALIVILFLAAFMAALYRAFSGLPIIGPLRSRHRIEQSSGLDHRPLTAIDDRLANSTGDTETIILWQEHQKRMIEAAARLRLRPPQASLAERDPWAVRSAISLLLVIGVVVAGADGLNRLGQALLPDIGALGFTKPVGVSLWITPPAYTGKPPVVIHLGGDDASRRNAAGTAAGGSVAPIKSLTVPTGSTLMAQVNDGGALPSLKIDEAKKPFNRIGADAYHLEIELKTGSRLSVIQGDQEIAGWSLSVVQDTPPVTEFFAAPGATPQLRLNLPFTAEDDYGITGVTASIRRLDGKAIPGGLAEIILRLPLPQSGPGQRNDEVKGKSNHDLISHIWAGLPVLVHLLATDEKGQAGLSNVEPVVLPERRFSHPAAKEIYEIRKGLTTAVRDRRLAMLKLDQMTEEPSQLNDDRTIYLTLRVARERLKRDRREAAAVTQVQKMLWDIALRIEEGRAATAGMDLRAAQKKLMEAIERSASVKELEELMAEVQRALNRFMSSLMRELQQRGQLSRLDPNARTMTNQDLQRFLDRARELLRQGSRDAAKKLMAELQRMLENLRGALAQGDRMSKGARQAQKGMRELRDIIRKQQKLLDDTYRQARKERSRDNQESKNRENPDSKNQSKESGKKEGLKRQEGIRKQLGGLMRRFSEMMGKIPKGLGDAERTMRESEQALGKGKPSQSISPQSKALEALRKGARSSASAFAQRIGRGQRNGQQWGPQGGRFGMFSGPRLRGLRPGNRDPFGRPAREDGQQGTATGRVEIPGEGELQRAHEILKELRRRAGDLWRPDLELEYIERLLKRF